MIERDLCWRALLAVALTAGSGLDGAGIDCFLLPDFEEPMCVVTSLRISVSNNHERIYESLQQRHYMYTLALNAISKSGPV